MTQYHYHGEADCGHKLGFDVDADLLQISVNEGVDDFSVKLPCKFCGGKQVTVTDVMPGGTDVQFCVTCKKGFDE